jgi:hypothetical protein
LGEDSFGENIGADDNEGSSVRKPRNNVSERRVAEDLH